MGLTQIIININIVVRLTIYTKVFSKNIKILKHKNISRHNNISNMTIHPDADYADGLKYISRK